jgi:glutathione S-transferase
LTGACSLASLISLHEAGVPHEAFAVERGTKKTADGQDLNAINPKGYVPVLVLDDGQVLTENVAVLMYIGSLDKTHRLLPEPGSMGCFRVIEWLAYINSEIHKNYSPLFRPNSTDDMKKTARELILTRLGFIEQGLGDKTFLTGSDFTVADAYLYVVLSWRERVGVDISSLPKLTAFFERARARPSVQQARRDEGLPL